MTRSSATTTSTARKGSNTVNLRMHNLAIVLFVCCSSCITLAVAFSPSTLLSTTSRPQNNIRTTSSSPQRTRARTALQNFKDDDDEDKDLENYDANTAAQIRKARKLLRDAKKKMEETNEQQQQLSNNGSDNADSSSSLPFFAQQSFTATAIDHTQKIKSKTKKGIIADGETMTSLSNSEPWERRSLSDIGFESEAREDYDGNEVQVDLNGDVLGGQTLAERDLAASIYNLRKVLQNEDFRSVFDSRNRFIGEVD